VAQIEESLYCLYQLGKGLKIQLISPSVVKKPNVSDKIGPPCIVNTSFGRIVNIKEILLHIKLERLGLGCKLPQKVHTAKKS
jgi:hypothetical protein